MEMFRYNKGLYFSLKICDDNLQMFGKRAMYSNFRISESL